MASRVTFVRLWRRFSFAFRAWQTQRSNFAPALAVTNGLPVPQHSSTSVFDIFMKPLLMAVMRNRRSVEQRRKRRFAENRMEAIKLKESIVVCLNCGEHHEKDTICGNCYSKVRKETDAMRTAMGDDEYHFNHPRSEVEYVYLEDNKEAPKYKGKYIVEMKKNRPDWFPPNLKTKV